MYLLFILKDLKIIPEFPKNKNLPLALKETQIYLSNQSGLEKSFVVTVVKCPISETVLFKLCLYLR